ncbi:MAG: BPSS1780 family membrane protein [Pseudomonadota bacterium]
MTLLPAKAGWHWVKQGLGLFGQQPGALTLLFMTSALFMLVLVFPLPLVNLILTPLLMAAFSQACVDIEQGKTITPAVLFAALRTPAARTLFRLGLLYMAAVIVLVGLVAVIEHDTLSKIAELKNKQENALVPPEMIPMHFLWTFLCASLIHTVMLVFVFFSTALIHQRQMKLAKAMFFSLFGMLGAVKAFLMLALIWFMTLQMAGVLLAFTLGDNPVVLGMVIAFVMLLTPIACCSLHAGFRHIFAASAPAD